MLEYLFWESKIVQNKWFEFFLKKISNVAQKYVIKHGLHQNIYINNFLLSTNLYPEFTQEHINDIKNFLIQKYPHYAIIFRSINTQNSNLLSCFSNWTRIVSRQVFISTQNES